MSQKLKNFGKSKKRVASDFPSHELNEYSNAQLEHYAKKDLSDSVPLVLGGEVIYKQGLTLGEAIEDYHDLKRHTNPLFRHPSIKAFICLNCHYVLEFPMDAVLHAIPMCERCFGSMQAIDYVGAE